MATFVAWIGQRLPRLVSIFRPEAAWLGATYRQSPTQFCVYNHGNTGLAGILPVSSAPDFFQNVVGVGQLVTIYLLYVATKVSVSHNNLYHRYQRYASISP